jgi:hypothetical protein
MRAKALASAAIASCGLVLIGCRAREEPAPYEFVVRVTSDPGRPLAGAVFSYNDAQVGVTKTDGTVRLAIRGVEGEVFGLSVGCPEGFRSPTAPLQVTLRRQADLTRRPEYAVSCPPKSRAVVVAVRADNGKNLPVLYLGQEVARTDASGAAHMLLYVSPDDPFEVTLGTTEKGAERLRPQNPSLKFVAKDQDDVFTFDQRFVIEPAPRRAAPRPDRPRPL